MVENKIKVVIADDSIRYRTILKKLLENHPQIEVVGEAVNGIKALELVWDILPDVILMDLEMPIMDGMTALQHLMIHIPTPTIMFSRLTQEGTARCFDALKNGAVDFFSKDSLRYNTSEKDVKQLLAERVICAANVFVKAVEPVFPKGNIPGDAGKVVKTLVFCEECGSREELVIRENEDQGGVICTRCSEFISLQQRNRYRRANCASIIVAGQGAYFNLLKLIPELQQDINGAILVIIDGSVEHVDAFTRYLDAISTIAVVRIADGLKLQGGTCYVGCDNENIHLKPYSADYTLKCSFMPFEEEFPVDRTLLSVANIFREQSTAVFLSSNERQGAAGLIRVNEHRGNTLVLDPKKCLYKRMGYNILDNFTVTSLSDEISLAREINAIHGRYRDTIVMA
ncbi:MAG: chemotaxis protein CheB [Desulfocapsaceae bacterium]|nr:chemotaxis protein CheB [Desulfocapsaceae bacterium]